MKRIRAFFRNNLDDLLVTAGEMVIVYGIYRINPTGAILAAGILLIVDGIVIGMGQKGAARK